jgi:hypothetical protein
VLVQGELEHWQPKKSQTNAHFNPPYTPTNHPKIVKQEKIRACHKSWQSKLLTKEH